MVYSAALIRKLLAVCASSAFALNLPVRAETGVTDKEILIGTANALSGPSAFVGKQMNIGFEAYVKYTNEHGGVNGRTIKVISGDDHYETDGAITTFKSLMSDGVFGVTGCYGAALIAKYVPMAMNSKVPLVGFSSGPTIVKDPVKRYVFTIRPDFVDEETQVCDKLWEEGNLRKFGVLYQSDTYGNNILTGVQDSLKKRGATVLVTGTYIRNANNLDEAFQKIKTAEPEVVILGAVQVPSSEMVKMCHKANWHPVFVLNSGSAIDDFAKLAGPDAERAVVTEVSPQYLKSTLPAIKKYNEILKTYYPQESPNFTSLRGFNNAVLWVEALKRAGKDLTREKFVDTLESIHNWDCGLGKDMSISFSPTNHVGRSNLFYLTVHNGEVVKFSDWKNLKSQIH